MARRLGPGRGGLGRPVPHLITGGAGFIGSHLAEALVGRGDTVTVLDDLSTGRRDNLAGLDGSGARLVEGSVLDADLVADLVDGCEVVVHLAAAVGVQRVLARTLESLQVNVVGTATVLEAAAKRDRTVLVASSSEVYGRSADMPVAEDADCLLGPPGMSRWSYAAGKLAGEALAGAYRRESGLRVTVVRLFNTAGPRQRPDFGMVVPRLARQAVAGEAMTVFGDGTQTRCFCHVSDAVGALVTLLDHPGAAGEVFNVGSGEEVTILDLAHRIRALARSPSEIRLIPYEEAYGPGFQDMPRRVPDTAKLAALTGWRPTNTLDRILTDAIYSAQLSLGGTGCAE